MAYVDLLFDSELSFFLPKKYQNQWFGYEYTGTPSIKHLVESLGVPHTEIGEVLVDSQQASINDILQPFTQIRVCSSRKNENPFQELESEQNREPAFILDNHLGRLARYLRMLGFDVLYCQDLEDDSLAAIAAGDNRILLTRDRRLLMRKIVEYGYCLRSLDPKEQVIEILDRYELKNRISPFKRCLVCNHELAEVDKLAILNRLEPLTRRYYQDYKICPSCSRIYWKGSHYTRMLDYISTWAGTTSDGSNPNIEEG